MSKNLKTIVIGTTLTAESDWIVRTGAAIAGAWVGTFLAVRFKKGDASSTQQSSAASETSG